METVERTYSSAGPKDIAGEIRQLWFSDPQWDVLVASQGIRSSGKLVDIESKPNKIAEMFDMADLAPKEGGRPLVTPLGTVDIGHVIAGIDARLSGSPEKFPVEFVAERSGLGELSESAFKHKTLRTAGKGDVRDFATWAGDLAQAYSEYLVERYVKKDTSATLKAWVALKAAPDELLGDIHGYIAHQVWHDVPGNNDPAGNQLKVSNILRTMYLVDKQKAGLKNPTLQSYMEKVSGKGAAELRDFVVERVLAFSGPWFASRAFAHRGWRKSKGWSMEGIFENSIEEFKRHHAENEARAGAADKLGGLVQSFLDLLKGHAL